MILNTPSTVAQNVVAMYRHPDNSSEMVSQAIFGEVVTRFSEESQFTLIRTPDRYEGWVLSRWLGEYDSLSDHLHTTIAPLFANVVDAPDHSGAIVTKLTVASHVILGRQPVQANYASLVMPAGGTAYTHIGNLSSTFDSGSDLPDGDPSRRLPIDIDSLGMQLTEAAKQFVGTPYLWGGTTPFGLDCSGFTQLVYKINGIQLLRDAAIQMGDRRFGPACPNDRFENASLMPGDLVFFGNSEGEHRISHVGMAIGGGEFIHSAGSGRGVLISYCSDPEFSSIYAGARRLLPHADPGIDAA